MRSYTTEVKANVLESIRAGQTIRQASEAHGVPESTVRGWVKQAADAKATRELNSTILGPVKQPAKPTEPTTTEPTSDVPNGWDAIEAGDDNATNGPAGAEPTTADKLQNDFPATIPSRWEVRSYDVWESDEDGYTVNDSFNMGEFDLDIPVTVNNEGTEYQFLSATPTDDQIRGLLGIKEGWPIQTNGDDIHIDVESEEDSYPLGSLFCVSHSSLSPVKPIESETGDDTDDDTPPPVSGGSPDDDNELSESVLIAAGQDLFAVSFADAVERAGGRFPSGANINQYTPKQPDSQLIRIVRQYVKDIESSTGEDRWPLPVATVFDAMGLATDKERADALYYLIMGCVGHGVGLADDHSDMLDSAAEKLGMSSLDPSPAYLDSAPMDEIAEAFVAEKGHTLDLGIKPTVRNLAQTALDWMEQRKRGDDGPEFWTFKDGRPQWLIDMAHEAHGDMGPDDHRYAFIFEALAALAETDDPEDVSLEPDIYTHDLFAWLASRVDRTGYVDDARKELGADGFDSITDELMAGQAEEKREVLQSIISYLEGMADSDDEDSEDDKDA